VYYHFFDKNNKMIKKKSTEIAWIAKGIEYY